VKTNEKKTRRRYDEQFKRSAVEMLERGERGASQLAAELGIAVWNLYEWKRIYGKAAAGAGAVGGGGPAPAGAAADRDLAAENARLRKELEAVSRQRDILKKACAILGQESGNASR